MEYDRLPVVAGMRGRRRRIDFLSDVSCLAFAFKAVPVSYQVRLVFALVTVPLPFENHCMRMSFYSLWLK